jgi:hypothetical protein
MWVSLAGPKILELRPRGGHLDATKRFWDKAAELQKRLFAGEPIEGAGPLGLDW